MNENIKAQLHRYIDEMNEYQHRLLLGFIKKLFHLDD